MVSIARFGGGGISEPMFGYWEQNNPGFEDLAAYYAGTSMNLSGGDKPELVEAVTASHNYFHLFGAKPILGRTFGEAEDAPGKPRVLVMSYSLWRRRFGGDPSILGRIITLGGAGYSVIGILPQGFQPPAQRVQQRSSADAWVPLQADPSSTNEAGFLTVSGRLTPSVTLAEANARTAVVAKRYQETHAAAFRRDPRIQVDFMKQQLIGDVRPALLILLGAVGLVLLLACANVARLWYWRGRPLAG